ncbi:hypothetical protein ACJDU8_02385 [Clostridium sp. WILCCON 0269]|uniref:Uncharacterized protein n=1 Tax=Candidatus Clostridium eludens TaxID=3381663 RepID=A0ABW8SGX3_9CLOT
MDKELQNILQQLLEGQTNLKNEVKKNSIKLESIEREIDIITEVQTAHKQQTEFCSKNTNALIEDKTKFISRCIKECL